MTVAELVKLKRRHDESIYCPVNGWDCPYWRENGKCIIDNPMEDCDDFAFFWDDWDDYDSAE